MPCVLCCYARYPADHQQSTKGETLLRSHIWRLDNYWQNIARAEMNELPFTQWILFFLQECVGCSLNLREKHGFQLSGWAAMFNFNLPKSTVSKSRNSTIRINSSMVQHLFSVQDNVPSLQTKDAPPMAGCSGLSRVALVLLAKPRLDEAQKADEAVQKSEVTCRLVSKATPNASHERRICSRYIKLKSCGGKQATVVIQLKTRSSWALANDLTECGLLSRPDGHLVYARWLIR